MAQYGHWFFYYITGGLLCSICFLLGVPSPFAFLRLFLALFLTLHSHEFLLYSLGFPDPITLSLILGAHRLAINPLLSLLSLLWACCGPFSLFHIIYYPWFTFSLFPEFFKPIYPLKAHLLISWACDSLFLPLRINEFSIHLPTLFYHVVRLLLSTWASKMAINI